MDNLTFFLIFNVLVLLFVIADFVIVSRNASTKCVAMLTVFWIVLGALFSIVIFAFFGTDAVYEYLTAYCIEKSLSIDNMFVFYTIFSNFGIKSENQHKLLFIGIWSALIFRALMIFVIGKFLSMFSWATYIFGLLILYMGATSFGESKKTTPAKSLTKAIKNYIPLRRVENDNRLFIIDNGKFYITHLLIAVIMLEVCDIIFAVDSIPALFSVTTNNLIIYTSNAFAIIGLRSLYSSFAKVLNRFYYVKHAIGVILCLVGIKMILANYIHISPAIYLLLITGILAVAFLASKGRVKVKDM